MRLTDACCTTCTSALYYSRMQASVSLDTSSPTSSAYAARSTAAATTSTTAGTATTAAAAGVTDSSSAAATASTRLSPLKGSPITAAGKRTSLSAAGTFTTRTTLHIHHIDNTRTCTNMFTLDRVVDMLFLSTRQLCETAYKYDCLYITVFGNTSCSSKH